MLAVGTTLPSQTQAGILSDIIESIKQNDSRGLGDDGDRSGASNLQTFSLPRPASNIDPTAGRGDGDVTIVDNSAVAPQEGPSGTIADIAKPQNTKVSLYVVREGDTVESVAKLHGVSTNTIVWSNNLSRHAQLTVGQKLIILPVSGIPYKVKSGDTIASIAKHTGGNVDEISTFNGIDDETLTAGTTITIPNVDGSLVSTESRGGSHHKKTNEPAHNVGPRGSTSDIAYYIAPLDHYLRTQRLHGYNAVDLAASVGTPILAAAAGTVVVAQDEGWNGGYGKYVVIDHDNGSQTLYAHALKIIVEGGESVGQGQIIGYVGESGRATGPHVHFEIRNGIRNPF